jgi:hypothetical protein
MMVSTEVKTSGDFLTQWQTKHLSEVDMRELESEMQNGLDQEFRSVNARVSNAMQTKLTDWKGAEIVTLGNRKAVVFRFQRQMANNPPVEVSSYAVFDNDRMHKVIVSFREEERELWESDFDAMLATLRFAD